MLSSPGTSLPAPTRLRVLLVDDDLLVLRATHRMLRRELDVVMAESAEAALGLFTRGSASTWCSLISTCRASPAWR